MIKKMKHNMMAAGAATFTGLVSGVESASANDFTTIVTNMETSISTIPGLISGVSYMSGILLGVLGILKIKDHVENPGQTPLQHGAIRLAAGGGLFALPIVYEAMRSTIGDDGDLVEAPEVKALEMKVQ
ncbi:MAG: hypothetical protein DI551_00340 [Micavibrio aeruginosavorus]|uniref:Uncharacterized protein n=1 Tax=Micavibrio aeruginosavorus TaxID=349221 RepID=A0A2W5N7X3_9BACT|nr:MAG: hypothetical protein DI551_00340 [Micavibrio aeruginosavorus]